MLQVVLFILSVALVNGWGADCVRTVQEKTQWITCNGYANCPNPCTKYCDAPNIVTPPSNRPYISGVDCYYKNSSAMDVCGLYNDVIDDQSNCGQGSSIIRGITCWFNACYNQCAADSIACLQNGGTFVRNGEQCECQTCTESDTTFKESSCAYDSEKGKYLNIVNTITRTNCEVTVKEDKYYALTCDTTCNENSELTCMGSIDGVNVYLRGCNGKVTKCEADGSCDFALQKVANGECENPNAPPNPNSSSGANSSSSEAGSSGSGNSSGSGDWEWLKDSLHVIHIEGMETNEHLTNFQPFITGTYDAAVEISGTTHDINSNILNSLDYLSDIRTNTGNTAQNTNNINSKLTNTNQLLTDLNNKSWNVNVRPEITVEGDTTIVNVQTDTAHSGAAILDFLKGMFNGADTTSNYNPNDTAGMGDRSRSLLDSIAGMGDTVPNMHDSLAGAVQSYKNRFDSVGAQVGRITGDSLASWNNKLLNNGVLQGNGSNSCPSILNTPFEVHIGSIDYTTTKTLGMYLCTPISPFNVTLWTLARVILRAVVSIACMWALYRCVLGINEDEE